MKHHCNKLPNILLCKTFFYSVVSTINDYNCKNVIQVVFKETNEIQKLVKASLTGDKLTELTSDGKVNEVHRDR